MGTLAALLTTAHDFPVYLKIIFAFLGGLLPVLFWLWFWEHEEKTPEPKKIVLFVFLAGMLAVLAALPIEQALFQQTSDFGYLMFGVAVIEELLKFAAAYIIVLSRAENHEPIDSMMYMIIAALGFAAAENGLFLFFGPVMQNNTIDAINTGNLRFIGANLLHVVASSIIGFSLSLSFYSSKRAKVVYVSIGVITAIVLHAFFNLSIMIFNRSLPILPFFAVWIAIIAMLLAFEKVKSLRQSA